MPLIEPALQRGSRQGGGSSPAKPPDLDCRFGIDPYLAIAQLSQGRNDYKRLREGEILEPRSSVDRFEPDVQAMMMGRCVSHELSESEFSKLTVDLGGLCAELFGPRAKAWRPQSSAAYPMGWQPPAWLGFHWPIEPVELGPSLWVMRERFAIGSSMEHAKAAPGRPNVYREASSLEPPPSLGLPRTLIGCQVDKREAFGGLRALEQGAGSGAS